MFEEDVRKMYDACKDLRDRALVSLLWLTCARVGEIAILRKKDIDWNDERMNILIKTFKRTKKADGSFDLDSRTLSFTRPQGVHMNIYLETVIQLCEAIQPDDRLLPFTVRWAEKRIEKLSMLVLDFPFTPYHFRHSGLTIAARNSYSLSALMTLKGAKNIGSIAPYIHAQPHLIQLEKLRKERNMLESD